MQNASILLEEFQNKLNELKIKSYRISEEYMSNKDSVLHHKLLSKVMNRSADPKILASLPGIQKYINDITAIDAEIIKLRDQYQAKLKSLCPH